MDGQADTAPVSADEVARFLVDNPNADRTDDEQEDLKPDDESPESQDEDQDKSETEDDSPDDGEKDPAKQPDPTSSRKIKVTVKGDDGADQELEVDEKELASSYLRHADYTKKTQELARREEQAAEIVRTRVTESQNHFMQQAQLAHAAVQQLAGLKSPQEMMQLAQVDPAGYVAEQARAQQIQMVLQNIQNSVQQEQFKQQQQVKEDQQKAFQRCWGVIGQKGIDKPKLQHIFDSVQKDYGVPQERFANLSDPALVMLMADAVAYRELQKKTPEVMKKAAAAPRLPQGGNVPRTDSRDKRQVERLRSGRGSRDDLAAFISKHNL